MYIHENRFQFRLISEVHIKLENGGNELKVEPELDQNFPGCFIWVFLVIFNQMLNLKSRETESTF